MKIVHIIRGNFDTKALSGVYKIIDLLSSSLVSLGAEVVVCSVGKPTDTLFKPSTYRHVWIPESKIRLFITKQFQDFVKEQTTDTIFHFHSVFIPWYLDAMKYLRKHGYQRIVLTPHGQYMEQAMKISLKKQLSFLLFDSRIIKEASIIHLIGRTEFTLRLLPSVSLYEFIPNGCDTTLSVPNKKRGNLIFGYLGRLDIKQKGLDNLISSFLEYKKAGGTGKLQLAGDGPDKSKLIKRVRKSPYRESVYFMGVVYDERKWDFLNECAFFCHPSRWDVFPTSVLEAANCGVPLIVTEATNIDTLVKKYNAGVVLSDANVKSELKDAFFYSELLFQQKKAYEEMCNNSKQMIEIGLNWNRIVQKFTDQLYMRC
ncbi:MAG: glycosyltransferase [Paludibacteraceae bacterium]